MAEPVLETESTASSNSSTSITIAKPIGTVSGNTLLAGIVIDATSGADPIDVPSGWTAVGAQQDSTLMSSRMFWIIAGGSEPSDYTWDGWASEDAAGFILRISGAHATTPIDESQSNPESSSTVPTANSITTNVDETLAIAMVGQDGPYLNSYPGGSWTDGSITISPSAAEVSAGYAYKDMATAGATGNADFGSSSSRRSANWQVSIAPAVAAAGGNPYRKMNPWLRAALVR